LFAGPGKRPDELTVATSCLLPEGRRDGVCDRSHADRQDVEPDPKRTGRVVDSARYCGGRPQITGFTRPLLAEYRERRRRAVVDNFDLRNFVSRWEQIVHKGLGDHLAFVVVDELFHQRRPDTVGNPAERHTANNVRVDDGSAIVTDDVAPDFWFAEQRIEGEQDDMKFERVDRVHLDAAVCRWQLAAGRDLHDVSDVEPWFEPGRQFMKVAVGDVNELRKAALSATKGLYINNTYS
jgi:hypothetical protein